MRRPNPVVLGLGVVGWLGLVWLGWTMFTATPRTAGFDLELVLQAGRDVAAGQSPYDAAMVGGTAPGSTDLFYSYPPPVAQFFSLFAGVPWVVDLTVLQHGRTPLAGIRPEVRISQGTVNRSFLASLQR